MIRSLDRLCVLTLTAFFLRGPTVLGAQVAPQVPSGAVGTPTPRGDSSTRTRQALDVPAIDYYRMADSLQGLDPADAVSAAAASGDHRLWGLEGYVLEIPGIRGSDYLPYQKRLGFRAVPHASHAFMGKDHRRYNSAAYRYAREYNRILLCRLQLRSDL